MIAREEKKQKKEKKDALNHELDKGAAKIMDLLLILE